jgi:GNAT superfamily N-acetyltransferase
VVEITRTLAESHNAGDDFTATGDMLEAALFGKDPIVGCLIAEIDGTPAGCAFWHRSFSTFRGQEVMYLEDLAVLPQYRRQGIARELLSAIARLARERGYPSIYWLVMDWNDAARQLYETVGAEIETGTCFCRLHGDALDRLAA